MPHLSLTLRAQAVVLTMAIAASPLSAACAQEVPDTLRLANISRANLEQVAAWLERTASAESPGSGPRIRHEAQLAEAQRRLRDGDFAAGDRVIVRIVGVSAPNDTLVVSGKRELTMATLPALSVHGALRSELPGRVHDHVARYLRDAKVTVVPLVRISVLGAVTRPGYYAVDADAQLGDAIMLAGGPSTEADMEAIAVRRAGQTLTASAQTRSAMSRGLTLDQMGMLPGDEITIGQKRRRDWQPFFSASALVLGVLSSFIAWQAVTRMSR